MVVIGASDLRLLLLCTKWGNNLQAPAGAVTRYSLTWGSLSPRSPNARDRGHPHPPLSLSRGHPYYWRDTLTLIVVVRGGFLVVDFQHGGDGFIAHGVLRSEEGRVGKEC